MVRVAFLAHLDAKSGKESAVEELLKGPLRDYRFRQRVQGI